jgi:hypothetical protein
LRRIELKVYNGSYGFPGVLERLRRKLERSAELGECLMVDGEDVEGLSPVQVRMLFFGLPSEKIRPVGFPALRPFPLPVAGQPPRTGGDK